MEYARIIAITGLPGLFELISSKTDGGIVRSLEDKTTRFVSSRMHQFSHLESIEVYTTRYNVNLVEVLKAMGESNERLPDDKSADDLKAYFEKVYPDLDHSRVYSSDLKKMAKWFSILKANDIELKISGPEPAEEEAEEDESTEAGEGVIEEKPKKTKEKSAPEAEKSPAKKATAKEEKKEEKKEAPKKEASKKETPAKKPAAKARQEDKHPGKAAPKKAAAKKDDKKPASKAAPKKSAGKK